MNPNKARGITSTTGVGRVGVGDVSSSSDVILSKMVNDRSALSLNIPGGGLYASDSLLDITAERQSTNIDDYENILLTQPDLELPIQILISSILSPKTANKITLKHSLKPNELPPELSNKLLQSAKNCVENVYKIKDGLSDKLRKGLFTQGSSISIIMGEAAIDDVINGRLRGLGVATESLRKTTISEAVASATRPMGYLSDGKARSERMGLESLLGAASNMAVPSSYPKLDVGSLAGLKGFECPTVEDNPAVLGVGIALENMLEEKRQQLSSLTRRGSVDHIDQLYHDIQGGIQDMVIFPRPEEASRKSKTRPVKREVPTESCTVIFQTGNPKKHIGYLFLLDGFGGFASRDMRRDYWRNVSDMVGGNRETISSILSQAGQSIKTETQNDTLMAMATSAYFRDMAKSDIERRMMNGSIGNGTVADKEAFFNLMFERAMSGRQTRILYVPADMVSYWAYRYNSNGTGRSMLEDNKFLAGIRSMLTVANAETALRNSIDYTKLGITLDEKDPHKTKTKEQIIDQYVRHRLRSTPWNTTSPRKIIEMIQMAGVSIDIDGGDNYPGTKVSITREDIQQREVNMDLDESIFRRLMMGFGIAPEIVDLSTQIEFSSKIVTSNELSLKRVMMLQDITNYLIRQEAIKTFLSDPVQMDEFEDIVREYIAKSSETNEVKAAVDVRRVVNLFLGAYEVNLPRPENGLEADMAEFEVYMNAVDKALEAIVNEEALGGLDDSSLADQYRRMVAIVRQYKAMQWMSEHDFMTTLLTEVKQAEEEGLPDIVAQTVSHYKGFNALIKSMVPRLMAQNVSDSEQLTEILNRLERFRTNTEAGDGSGDSADGSTNSSENAGVEGGGSDDDLFGDDTFEEPKEDPGQADGGDKGNSTGDQDTKDDAKEDGPDQEPLA